MSIKHSLPKMKESDKQIKNIRQKNIPSFKLPRISFRSILPEHKARNCYGTDLFSIVLLALSAALLIVSRFIGDKGFLTPAVLIAALVLAGKDVFLAVFDDAAAGNCFSEETVFVLASVVTAAFGNFADGAVIMFAYRVCRMAEALSEKKIRSAADWLNIELPKRSSVETGEGIKVVSPKKIKKGRIVIVPADGIIPVDGIVLEGDSRMDTFPITGCEQAVGVSYGSTVYSGCINKDNEIRIKAIADFDDSTACIISSMLTQGMDYLSEKEKLIDYWTRLAAAGCIAAGIILAIVPPIILGIDWPVWIGKGCALAALSACYPLSKAVSMSFHAGIVLCASKGINVGGNRILEKLTSLSAIIFNKTGTLTEDRYEIEEICAETMDDYELLAIAAVAEQFSDHPIARAVCRECMSYEHMERSDVQFEEIEGRGMSAGVRGRHILVGNAGLLEDNNISCVIPRRGGTAIHVAVDGKYCGYIILGNKLKENAFDTIEALRQFKINSFVMLTGDLLANARAAASTLNFDMMKAELSKEEKLSAIEYLKTSEINGRAVAYVCSGCEDENFFTKADIGVSIGALGCRGAMSDADVLIMADDMKLLPKAVEYSVRSGNTASIETIVYGAFKLLLILLTAAGLCPVTAVMLLDLLISAALLFYSCVALRIND
ncbi:MAG: HAD-IC family P-type ATPase [Eubacteriales bacterium]|nr:HAD-IC family P-type ATPase [Eubacteriales bacterium]